jgi:hypothetical protein
MTATTANNDEEHNNNAEDSNNKNSDKEGDNRDRMTDVTQENENTGQWMITMTQQW